MSNAELEILRDCKKQLDESNEAITKLRKRLATVEAMYRDRMVDMTELTSALEFIAANGGKSTQFREDDDVPPIHCNGEWCSEQAHRALDKLRSKPVDAFTLI